MFTLSFKTDDSAFEVVEQEIPRILRRAADMVESGDTEGTIFCLNGNRVGSFILESK